MTTDIIINYFDTEQGQSLIEDCQSIKTECEFNSRWDLIEGYHKLGERIVTDSDFQSYAKGNLSSLQYLAKNVNIGERTLYYAIDFYKAYPELSLLPEGKNIGWSTVIKKYLSKPKEEPDYHVQDEIYRFLFGVDSIINHYGDTVKIKVRTGRILSGYETKELTLGPKGSPQFVLIMNDKNYVLVDWLKVEMERLKHPQLTDIPKEAIIARSD